VNDFEGAGAAVLGISPDSVEQQKKFEQDHGLKVALLADADKAVTSAYGCYGEKQMYGRAVQGITRSTYLIDPQGKVAQVWSNVKVDGHAEAVLKAVQAARTK
jgi:thioredoxin-dependent peroxiredoxin